MKKNLKSILLMATTVLVIPSTIFALNILLSSRTQLFQSPDFRFESISVNGNTTADMLSNENNPLSAYNQPIFQTSNMQRRGEKRLTDTNQTKDEIKFDFYWDGEILDILQGVEVSELEALTYTDYNLPFIPETKKINNYNYRNPLNFEQNAQLNLEEHDFYLSYYGLTFTNQDGSKEYLYNGMLDSSSTSRFTQGSSVDLNVWGGTEEVDYGVGVFSYVSLMNTQSDGLGESYLTPNFPYGDLKENFKNKVFSQEIVNFTIVEEGIKMTLTVDIEKDFDYQYVDISHIQITGVHKNNENQLDFFIANFSSFGKNETLVLSPRNFPHSNRYRSSNTNDLYYDEISPLKINDNNEITFAFHKDLASLTSLSNGWRSSYQDVYLIYSNDPNQQYFSNLNFNEINMDDVLDDAILSKRDNGNVLPGQDKEDSQEILSQMKPLALIDFSILPGEFYNYSSINLHYNGQVSQVTIKEPIFTTVEFVNLGISLNEDSYLMVIPLSPTLLGLANWVDGSNQVINKIAISADNGVMAQTIASWKDMAQIAKDIQIGIKDNFNSRTPNNYQMIRDYNLWSLYLPFSYPYNKEYIGNHYFFPDENNEIVLYASSLGFNIFTDIDYYDFFDDSTLPGDFWMTLFIEVNELNINFNVEILLRPN